MYDALYCMKLSLQLFMCASQLVECELWLNIYWEDKKYYVRNIFIPLLGPVVSRMFLYTFLHLSCKALHVGLVGIDIISLLWSILRYEY